jgi:dTDP-4-amino-4,6-dideoxygalactose transaminase
MIPFVDLKAQYNSIKKEIDDAIYNVINETAFIKGKYVEKFEKEFAEKYGVNYCIGVANGTDAIYIVLKMLGIGPGDEVITTAHSWISTSETISQTGAMPVFIDIDDYYLIDVDKIEEKITIKTKAIIPVHLFGQACDMERIMYIAKKYNLYVVEDCAQAHFSEFKGKKVGTFGIAATFSFYPGKNLGAYGDAGAIITNNKQLAEKCRMYANHGALTKHNHEIEGINSRLDGLQAAILSVKLKYIDEWNKKRLESALLYNELLKSIPQVITPKIKKESKHIFHVYCIQAENRDVLKTNLYENGIETQIHYPTMLPFLPAYKYLNYTISDFPNAYKIQNKILSLPMYPELDKNEIIFIANKIKEIYKE